MDHYVGLDVSLKETHFCVMDGAGDVVARGREATQPELLACVLSWHAPGAGTIGLRAKALFRDADYWPMLSTRSVKTTCPFLS